MKNSPSLATPPVPKTVLRLIMQAESYLKQGKPEGAIAACTKALDIDPNAAAACKLLGNAWQRSNRPEEAMRWYRQAVKLQPQMAEAHTNLGSLYAQQQAWEEAIACYET
ncbi:MAG: tetratricopeptide repeat protein, partial [Microcoleus sp. SIO2G3]|nr:tetratricopeptide repeat protein [Microcoleus sp. SIO2G3]